MKKTNSKVISKLVTQKIFNYEIDGVTLGFSLNLDDKVAITKFVKILETALVDIEKTLNK